MLYFKVILICIKYFLLSELGIYWLLFTIWIYGRDGRIEQIYVGLKGCDIVWMWCEWVI